MDSQSTEKQSLLDRAARNFGRLLRGRGVAAVLELLTVAILARALSPAEFGQIVLIQTYVLIVRGLFNFKLFEAVIRFGVPALEAHDDVSLRRLLRLTLFIDLAASALATVVAVLAAPLVAIFLDWDSSLVLAAMLYSSVLVTAGIGTPKGILRLFDRFDVLGIQLMVSPVLRLGGVILALSLDANLLWLVVVLALGTLAGNFYLIARGWQVFQDRVGGSVLRGPSLKAWQQAFPGLRAFLTIVYLQTNVDMLPKHVSTLLAGSLLGPAAAGMLRLAREATKILSKPGALLQQVLFPDLVRLWGRGADSFRMILLRALLISGLFGVVFIVASIFGGRLLFSSALGPDYAEAAPLLTLLLLSATLELAGIVLRAAGYAIGHAGEILRLHLLSAVIYLASFTFLAPRMGLIGPGIAACVAATVTLVGIGWMVAKSIRETPLESDEARG
ncbi:MAG: lipopolysaccharide biosynthesis protein [Gammaproteobacteria bacterium]|nr:lipopolysaccharide biosynthesis protein [Gammaproteobacteria bacterium]